MVGRIFSNDEDFDLVLTLVDAARQHSGSVNFDPETLRRLEDVASRRVPLDSFERQNLDADVHCLHLALKSKLGLEQVFSTEAAFDTPTLPPAPASNPPKEAPNHTIIELIRKMHIRALRLSRALSESVEGIPERAFVRNHLDNIADGFSQFVESGKGRVRVTRPEAAREFAERAALDLDGIALVIKADTGLLKRLADNMITELTFLRAKAKSRHGDVMHNLSSRVQSALDEGDEDKVAFGLMEFEIRKNALMDPFSFLRRGFALDAETSTSIDEAMSLGRAMARSVSEKSIAEHLERRVAQLEGLGQGDCEPNEARSLVKWISFDMNRLVTILRAKDEQDLDELLKLCKKDALIAIDSLDSEEGAEREGREVDGMIRALTHDIALQRTEGARAKLAGLHIRASVIMRPYGIPGSASSVGGGSGARASGLYISQLSLNPLAFQSGAFFLGMGGRFPI